MAEPTNETMTPEEALAAIRRLVEDQDRLPPGWFSFGREVYFGDPESTTPVKVPTELIAWWIEQTRKINFAAILGAIEGVVRENKQRHVQPEAN